MRNANQMIHRMVVVVMATMVGMLRAATPAPYNATPNDASWSYTYTNQTPSSWTDPSLVKLKSITDGNVQTDAIIWSTGDMVKNPGIILNLPKSVLVDYYRIRSYIHTAGYGIPTSALSARTNSALPFVVVATNSTAETWGGASGAKLRDYTAATPTQLGRFDRRNEGSQFLMQFFDQGKNLNLGSVNLYGRWSTYDTVGTGFIGYDYEVLPGANASSAWTDDGNDLLSRYQGDYNVGGNPDSDDAGSIIWDATTMATTTVAVVFDMGGGYQVDSVVIGSYFHTSLYIVPPLKFEVSRDIVNPEWVAIGTYAGKPYTTSGSQSITITELDDLAGRYMRMSSTVVTNAPFDLCHVQLNTTPKPLWPLTTVLVVR